MEMEMSTSHGGGMGMHGMDMPGMGDSDAPDFHGMLLFFGQNTAYLSHLPMFSMPTHRYQVIMEVMLDKAGKDQLASVVKDREHTPTRMYSFTPTKNFRLPDLVSTDAQHPRLEAFPGTIVRGHFEPNHFEPQGEDIIPGVVARVKNVVHFNKFASHPQDPPDLQYLLFGRGQELFLAHVITRPPDFDHVLGVQIAGQQFTDDQLRHAMVVSFPGRSDRDPNDRLKEQEQLQGRIQTSGQNGPQPQVQVKVVNEFYFETRDLAR
jgi:hypothetical protein